MLWALRALGRCSGVVSRTAPDKDVRAAQGPAQAQRMTPLNTRRESARSSRPTSSCREARAEEVTEHRSHGAGAVTTFFTGSSAPPARGRTAGGAGAPSSRTHLTRQDVPTNGQGRRGGGAMGGARRRPPSRRPASRGSARRAPASRALRVATRWPPATLDPEARRAGGLAIGSAPLIWPGQNAHPRRTPDPWRSAFDATWRSGPDVTEHVGEAFAMRRSGVRIPSAPPSSGPDL